MRLHNELEVQKWALIKIAKEMAKSQDEKKELLTINYVSFSKRNQILYIFLLKNAYHNIKLPEYGE